MRRTSCSISLTCALLLASAAGAQGPGTPPLGAGDSPIANPAQFLLSHTGDLKLTDAQVVRLAAVARRADERHHAMRASMDSLAPAMRRGARRDSTSGGQMIQRFETMQPALKKMREQSHAELRDAITVLTPDQQAQAWEMIAARAMQDGPPRFGRPAGMMQMMRMMREMQPDVPPDGQPPRDGQQPMRRRRPPEQSGEQPLV